MKNIGGKRTWQSIKIPRLRLSDCANLVHRRKWCLDTIVDTIAYRHLSSKFLDIHVSFSQNSIEVVFLWFENQIWKFWPTFRPQVRKEPQIALISSRPNFTKMSTFGVSFSAKMLLYYGKIFSALTVKPIWLFKVTHFSSCLTEYVPILVLFFSLCTYYFVGVLMHIYTHYWA